MFHPLFNRPGDLPIPLPAPLYGGLIETLVGIPVRYLLKTGEYDPGKIPIREAGFSHLKTIEDRPGGMGKLVGHGPGRIEEIVLPAGILTGQTGKLAVQGHGPKNTVKLKLIFFDQIDPVGAQGGNPALAGKGIALMHIIARGHFHKEILYAVSFKGLEQPEIVGKDDKPLTPLFQGLDQVEVLTAVPVGYHAAEIGIPIAVSDQQDRPVPIGRKLTSHNGLDTHFLGCLEKKDQPVQTVGIGQGQSVHPLLLGGAAEFFNGTDTPAFGVMGMDIEMDKIHDIFTTEAQRTQSFF